MPYFLKISLLAAALMTTSCSQGDKNSAHPAGADNTQSVEKQGDNAPIPVTVVAASSQNVPVYAAAPGTVAAMNTVTINPQVSGQLISLHFREGESVKKANYSPKLTHAHFRPATIKPQRRSVRTKHCWQPHVPTTPAPARWNTNRTSPRQN